MVAIHIVQRNIFGTELWLVRLVHGYYAVHRAPLATTADWMCACTIGSNMVGGQ